MIILDISDVAHSKKIGQLSMSPPFASSIGVHTVIPMPEKGLAFINSEAIQEDCKEPLQHASIVDNRESRQTPRLMRCFPCRCRRRTGRSKASASAAAGLVRTTQNTLLHNPFVQPQGQPRLSHLLQRRFADLPTVSTRPRAARSLIFPAAGSDASLTAARFRKASSSHKARTFWSIHAAYIYVNPQKSGTVDLEIFRQIDGRPDRLLFCSLAGAPMQNVLVI